MPPADVPDRARTRQEVIEELGLYPPEAFDFVERGLSYTVEKLHGPVIATSLEDLESRHVTGQELCWGLRDYALLQWGMLARTVLARWNITTTLDFGRIVYALVDNGFMQKRDEDSIDDFRNVYDFAAAFESSYKIECKV